ncbi:MAG: hypothetical protein WCY88_14545 [Spongiibacteraceae bacterium]
MLEPLKTFIDNPRKVLKLFSLGALLFFIGVGFIQGADKLIEPSLKQEVHTLLGMIIAGCGFFIAITAQLFLIAQRFRNLGKKPSSKD